MSYFTVFSCITFEFCTIYGIMSSKIINLLSKPAQEVNQVKHTDDGYGRICLFHSD